MPPSSGYVSLRTLSFIIKLDFLSHIQALNTLSIFTRAVPLPRKYSSSVSHSFLYCSICTLAAKKYFFVVARWSAGDVSFRGMETTTGRNDSIKRFDCSSRDDCPLIENCPSAPLDQERERSLERRWRNVYPYGAPSF